MATSLASVVDSMTVCCSHNHQVMGLPAHSAMIPEYDFIVSRSVA